MRLHPLRLGALIGLLAAGSARAQPEVVPAEHPVYSFLADQRVAGHLPTFRHEALPLDRRGVLRQLDSLQDHRAQLSSGSTRWLDAFRHEFAPDENEVHTWIGDGMASNGDVSAERYLAYSSSDNGEIRVIARVGGQFRSSDGPTETGTTLTPASGTALLPELVVLGHWQDWLGIYSGTFNGLQIAGDTEVLRADPEIASLYYVGFADGAPPGSYDRTSASLRVRRGPFSAEIANERLRLGPSPVDPLLLSDGADYFPFVRAGFEHGPFRYQFIHGALSDRTTFVQTDDLYGITGPERYLALHRVEAHLPSTSVAFTEAVVYGLRGPELAYLNPLFPIKPAEHALWDRDNTLFALDAVVRPLRGLELHGAFLADDLNLSRLGEVEGNNNKWAIQAGATIGGLVPGTVVFGEYTRIEPYVYTHRFSSNGSFYNSFTHNGFGLGHPLGPNADQWMIGGRAWLPGGVRAHGLVRYVRRGENPTDPETGETIYVGGDVRDGTQPEPFTKIFLAGDVYQGPGASLDVAWEPINAITTRAQVDWQSWNVGSNRLFVRLEASVQL